ncbi:glycerophosphodiester phosphodiesterase [Anoxynatronum buryatiense]|uniref:Glycerophosphoryl diester phosphodiesterase n=1 Tax=Anoxynatronum buryatiense TaxID=489973 RepID=A0AA45WY75_9CLOT|nr:glycerophosphodiester phosphodiesterase [Anoxynatronum buryatiense]SMP67355.1 glycerophosphoryl diester phosphodiesterase [Anoxynatronum buryatiense]
MENELVIFGHRGYSGVAPENTMAAFEKALKAGADGFELDVHLTKEGELVVCHDELLDRTTNGTGLIMDKTLAELKQLDAGGWYGEAYRNQSIPTLREALQLVVGKKSLVNIELKNSLIWYEGIEEKVIQMIHEMNVQDQIILSSFNHNSILRVKQLDNTLQTGVLYSCVLVEPWEYVSRIGASSVHPSLLSINREIVDKCHENGLKVYPFFDGGYEEMSHVTKEELMALGVDGIFTNYIHRYASE